MKTSNLKFYFILNCASLAAAITPWYMIFLDKLIVTQLVKKFTLLWNLKVHHIEP